MRLIFEDATTRMSSIPTPIDRFLPGRRLKRLAIRVFIDSSFWHRHWHCHRLPERSFSVSNRQFHICSRCTGIVIGLLLVPLSVVVAEPARVFFIAAIAVFMLDAVTQLSGLRKSTNVIRMLTGLFFPLSLAVLFLAVLG